MRDFACTILFFIYLALPQPAVAQVQKKIIVAADGSGDYRSIQAALNSLTDSSQTPRHLFIRNGVYREKLYIEKNNVILEGESRAGTIIIQSIARDAWRCHHNEDWGVATMNVDGDDITLLSLSIVNNYGFEEDAEKVIPCPSDSTRQKRISKSGHQMALRTMSGNRLRAINCHFKAYGGDTVSPWDVEKGMFYFRDCIMEGGVDFYCPRGWAWAENCQFISHTGPAAIWHDGSRHADSKTVLKNCSFSGFDNFNLGRYHRDAQFYLIDCHFARNMADKDIYLVPTDNVIQWGRRVFYHNSHREGGDYAWHRDNLHQATGAPRASDITVNWLFRDAWFPEADLKEIYIPARTHVRLRKKTAAGNYGPVLLKETMPAKHPANDFTKNAIPYYQTEGPAWENDKVGFRLYLDVRNGKDIFGKTTAALVMDTVGTYGDRYYHYLDDRWGMDLLKVGASLGAGALALQVKNTTGKDTLVRLGGAEVGQTTYEVVKDGPEEAVFRLHYKNWKVLGRQYNLTEEISIRTGTYYYQSKVTITGLRGDEKLVTGMVNLKSTSSYHTADSVQAPSAMYTHARQAENGGYLGMAILIPGDVRSFSGETPREGSGVLNTYTISRPVRNGEPLVYRFYAAWEKTDPRFADRTYFHKFLVNESINAAGELTSIENKRNRL